MFRYCLKVFHAGSASPAEIVEVERGADVMERIRQLLAVHSECERITVESDGVLMFAVDCQGRTLPRQ